MLCFDFAARWRLQQSEGRSADRGSQGRRELRAARLQLGGEAERRGDHQVPAPGEHF